MAEDTGGFERIGPVDTGGFERVPLAEGPSRLERFGTGVLDKVYGALQVGARAQPTAGGAIFAPDLQIQGDDPVVKSTDEMVRKREASIQAERKAAGQTGTDWWRTAGNVLADIGLTAPVAAIGPAAGAATAGKIGMSALGGAVGGAASGVTEPVTSGDFASEKAKQVGIGAAAGGVGGAVLGGLARAIAGKSAADVDKFIDRAYTRSIKPTVAGKSAMSQLDHYTDQARSAISSIIDNKANLRFADEAGEVTGQLPKSIGQFADAIDQTKQSLFQQYDALAQQAGAQGVKVDLAPAVRELEGIAADQVVKDLHPELAKYAADRAATFAQREAYSATDAQRAIQNLNTSLKAFYNNPTYETAGRASIDAMVANQLRGGLDNAIETAVAPGYQGLKNQYGALKAIEKDVVHRAIVEGRKNAGGGILGNIGDLVSAEQVIHGIMTLSPGHAIKGALLKSVVEWVKHLRDPNRAVAKLFDAAEKRGSRAAPSSAAAPLSSTGGMQPPRPGGRGQDLPRQTTIDPVSGGVARAPLSPASTQRGGMQPTGPAQDIYGGVAQPSVRGGVAETMGLRTRERPMEIMPDDPYGGMYIPGGGRAN